MIKHYRLSLYCLFSISLLLFLSGCMRQQLPFFYYTLASSKQVEGTLNDSLPVILVGPVRIASFLDKGQLIKQQSAYAITIEEQHRWAGDLQEMLSDALVNNLSLELHSNTVYPYLENRGIEGLQLEITLLHFERDVNGQALLQARWKIIDTNQTLLYSKASTFTKQPENSGYSSVVQGLSIGLSSLSKEIADAIRTTAFARD